MAPPSQMDQFWRLEDNLLDLGEFWPHTYAARNAHSVFERFLRLASIAGVALPRLPLLAVAPNAADRMLTWLLSGMSEDRLEFLGQEYFDRFLKKRLNPRRLARALAFEAGDPSVVLVSDGLSPFVRPIAHHLGFERYLAHEPDIRDRVVTGRIQPPLFRGGGLRSWVRRGRGRGLLTLEALSRDIGIDAETLEERIAPVNRTHPSPSPTAVHLQGEKMAERLAVRKAFAGKEVLLIGGTGFIGKVWLVKLLTDIPEVGRVHLLIRPQRSLTARERFERMVAESPVFSLLHERYGPDLGRFLCERVRVHPGDATQPDLGLPEAAVAELLPRLDLVVNSSGLTDFTPDLRAALAANVDAPLQTVKFVRRCDHAALLHLSTCYSIGNRDGRVTEELIPDYIPNGAPGFRAEEEVAALRARVAGMESEASGEARLRRVLTEAGVRRAAELGWPNTYTFTKSLGDSMLAQHGAGLPIALVRPSIVETSVREPFVGWNEGINTSTPISYLLGTTFRQLPANEHKNLDMIPVDLVSRGMILIGAALIQRCHETVYQLATSVTNPCNMRRSIELTCLAHRRHYLEQRGFSSWWKARADAIPVSKLRYMRLSAPSYQSLQRTIRRLFHPLSARWSFLTRFERSTNRVAKLIEIYEPFILHNDHVFEARHVELLSAALAPEEREAFGYDVASIDWKEYWIHLHIPAMRRWCYPLLEGRAVEQPQRQPFRLPEVDELARERRDATPASPRTGTEASWRSS